MVHLNGSVEKLADSMWAKIISRIFMPLAIIVLTIVVNRGFDQLKAMNEQIGKNASDIRNMETIRAVNTEPRLLNLERRVDRCCHVMQPEEAGQK